MLASLSRVAIAGCGCAIGGNWGRIATRGGASVGGLRHSREVVGGIREGQRLALGRKEGCPCCWQTGELREKMLGGSTAAGDDPQIAAAALKALNEARKYTGCRIWRRYS